MSPKAILNLLGVLSGLLICSNTGFAVVFTDPILFPPGTEAVDSSSGNHIDFTFKHSLPKIPMSGLKIISASLSVSHEGNFNEGPTREIWSVSGPENHLLGILGESEKDQKTDLFDVESFLGEGAVSWLSGEFDIFLSEQTPYNGEKLSLLNSVLEIHYELPASGPRSPSIPEPGTKTLVILGGALMLLAGRQNFLISGGGQRSATEREKD